MNKKNLLYALIPLFLAGGLVGGIFLGKKFSSGSVTPEMAKLMTIMDIIQNEYVDEISMDSLLDGNFAQLMSLLDPHSVYIPSSEL